VERRAFNINININNKREVSMKQEDLGVNTTAPLTNVSLCMRALERAVNRPAHLPGFVAFYGPSGWGKTTAAAYAANAFRAYAVEAKSTWTKKAFALAILKEMGIRPAATVYEMIDQVSEQLVRSGRPLIIDEFDHIVEKNNVELVRDIFEGSNSPILLIGEEGLENHLRRWERFHNRILDWVPAQPASVADAGHLRTLYCRNVRVEDDLLERVHAISKGAARRICVNLELVHETARAEGLDAIDLAAWGDRPFYTGEAPPRRPR
jgi:DNA transposition AAA+ family ATPase